MSFVEEGDIRDEELRSISRRSLNLESHENACNGGSHERV